MVKLFGDKYGLDKDRKKINGGEKFIIHGIPSIHSSKKLGDNGQPYNIAIIDGRELDGNALLKYYTSASVIVDQCRDMLKDSKPDGTLKEEIMVEVIEQISDKKRPYICFK